MQSVLASILVLVGLSLSACSHFQGSGGFKTGADYTSNEAQPPGTTDDEKAETYGKPSPLPFDIEWPVDNVRITQYFAPVKNPHHKGIDIGGRRGMPIMAAHDGHVIYTGRGFHGYGNMVLIEYDNKWATLYAHLQKIKVKRGAQVAAGTTIGTMGRTGHATGVHLHFELMHEKAPIDPMLYLRSNQLVGKQ